MRKYFYITFFYITYFYTSYGQCPTAGFTLSTDTICAGDSITITNTSLGATSYNWDFCGGDLIGAYTGISLGNLSSLIINPTKLSTVFDGTNWYSFVVSNIEADVIRLAYGNDLNNPNPVVTLAASLNTKNNRALATDITYDGSIWYQLIGNNTSPEIIKLNYGNNLLLSPVLSNVTGLDTSSLGVCGIDIVKEDSNYIAVVANCNNLITVLNFGVTIANNPSAFSFPVLPAIDETYAIKVVKDCDNWYGFCVGRTSNNLLKIKFGNSLLSPPPLDSLVNLGNFDGLLQTPQDIDVVNDGSNWIVYVQDLNKPVVQLNFGSTLYNDLPDTAMLDKLIPWTSNYGLNVIKHQSTWMFIAPNAVSNLIYKVIRTNKCAASTKETSTTPVPKVTYNEGGSYFISLNAYDAKGNTDFYIDTIFVKGKPIINFDTDRLCFNDTVQFFNQSSIEYDTILSQVWDFGDNTTSTLQNPTHYYADTGTYNVKLRISSSCLSDSVIKTVKIILQPTVAFSATDGCKINPIPFNDVSIDPLKSFNYWIWDFGDILSGSNNISIIQNPIHAFSDSGKYIVSLIAGVKGCTDTAVKLVSYYPQPSADFAIQNFCLGDSTLFSDKSTLDSLLSPITITSWEWKFDTTGTASSQNTVFVYPDTGTYSTKLIVSVFGCKDSVTKSFSIGKVNTKFSVSSPLCKSNTVSFTDLSTVNSDSIVGWKWKFGDGDSASSKNPIHFFADSGKYTVNLQTTSSNNCKNDSSVLLTVLPSPTALFGADTGCAGGTTLFLDKSLSPAYDSIVKWYWDFGDLSPIDSTQNPSHQYQKGGNYITALIVVSDSGCLDTSQNTIIAYSKPNVNFYYSNPCNKASINFTDSSSIINVLNDSIIYWKWDFGDGTVVDTSKDPLHTYNIASGFNVSLYLTSNHDCKDSLTEVLNVQSLADINFNSSIACKGDSTLFDAISTGIPGVSNWIWNFGDPSSGIKNNSTQQNTIHQYNNSGYFTVKLTGVSAANCSTIISRLVKVNAFPVADFIVPTLCLNNAQLFQDASTVENDSIIYWYWNWGDNSKQDSIPTPEHAYADTGYFDVLFTVSSASGCTSNVLKQTYVNKLPEPKFTFNPPFGNSPLTVNFTNITIDAVSYNWLFDDDSTSTDINPTHTYTDTGTYTIQLIAENVYGCVDTGQKIIRVMNPLLDVAISTISASINSNRVITTIELINPGNRDVSSLDLILEHGGNNAIVEQWSGSLPAVTGKVSYTFNVQFEIEQLADFPYICAYADKPNEEVDSNPANNKQCNSIVEEFQLLPSFPQPAGNSLTLQFILPYKDKIEIIMWDDLGKMIQQYIGTEDKGFHQYTFDLFNLSAGAYTYKVIFAETSSKGSVFIKR